MVLPRGWKLKVLSQEGAENVATHQYRPGKYTPLDLLLNPAWTKMAEALPRWLAPNLVTLFGFLPLVVTYGLLWRSSPYFDLAPPRWLAATKFSALLFYQTMDALDGKQARRTGSSTPLGQLFDHGCDCLTGLSLHAAAAMVLLPGANSAALAGLTGFQTCFFLAQWQEYHTGVLDTSYGPVGVTETQFSLMGLALAAGAVGPDAVEAKMNTLVQVPGSSAQLPLGRMCIYGWVSFCWLLGSVCAVKTTTHVTKEKGKAGLPKAVMNLVPVAALNALQFLWDPSFYAQAPREICLLTGVNFFYLTSQMIVFSMARMPYPTFQPILLLYGLLAGLSRTSNASLPLHKLLVAGSVCTGCWVLMWVHTVIDELKEKLGIYAFSLKKKQ